MSEKPWYESDSNVLALAQHLESQNGYDALYVLTHYATQKSERLWQEYQASLQSKEPAEPKLSDRMISDNYDPRSYIVLIAQKVEALEAQLKGGE